MPAHDLIPSLDPIPLPAPYWVFKLLLVVTFTLHILAMNFHARRHGSGVGKPVERQPRTRQSAV